MGLIVDKHVGVTGNACSITQWVHTLESQTSWEMPVASLTGTKDTPWTPTPSNLGGSEFNHMGGGGGSMGEGDRRGEVGRRRGEGG